MFGNAYQNGHYFQVWDTCNDKNDNYKQLYRIQPPSNKKYYDKQIKSYVLSLESQNSKMNLPASDQKQLALHQKYLVLHIFIPVGNPWSMELGLTDISGIRRRINLTTMQGKNEAKYFSVRYTFDTLQKGAWLFLAINVHSFIEAFKGQVFRSLDHLVINNSCILRRIFMMKEWQHWEIPKAFWFSSQIAQEFQLIEYRELTLPKINLQRSLHKQQSSPQKEEKQETIKHSKSNLVKSDIPYKIINRSKITQSSPVKSNIQPSVGRKKAVNLKLDLEKHSKFMQKSSIASNIQKIQSKQLIEQKKRVQKLKQKIERVTNKKSPDKSPKIQKSFQEDEAFRNMPQNESEANFQTSDQSFSMIYKPRKLESRFERWEKQPEDKDIKLNNGYKKSNEKLNKESKTVLSKENSTKMIRSSENKTQLQLIYDEMVGCYYHPQTQTYYEIKR